MFNAPNEEAPPIDSDPLKRAELCEAARDNTLEVLREKTNSSSTTDDKIIDLDDGELGRIKTKKPESESRQEKTIILSQQGTSSNTDDASANGIATHRRLSLTKGHKLTVGITSTSASVEKK
jgi:hypothetical protein